jgi:hypothetical protein
MTQIEEPKISVKQIVMGTRIDHVPAPETQQLYTWRCVSCQGKTVTESASYPSESAVVCNVCAPEVIQRLTRENNAELAFDMPPEAKAHMVAAADRLNIPVEEYLQQFVAWKTGKVLQGRFVNPSLTKKAKR